MNTRSALAPALAIALALSGCAATLGDVRPFPAPDAASRGYAAAPAVQPAYAAPGARDGGGSIYASAGGGHRGMHLFQDNKARQVGDLLTIVLVENTRARTNATTSVSKDSGVDMAAPTIFGRGVTVNGRPVLQAGIEGSRDFSGAGDSAQSNQLAGNITVTVVEDLGNGNLRWPARAPAPEPGRRAGQIQGWCGGRYRGRQPHHLDRVGGDRLRRPRHLARWRDGVAGAVLQFRRVSVLRAAT